MARSKQARKPIPVFKTEAAEREFWMHADSTEYIDWSKARLARFPNLRPSSTAISVLADRVSEARRRIRKRT